MLGRIGGSEMKIDRYEMRYNTKMHREEYFAIIGKKSIPMPTAFRDMYDDDHLDIEPVHSEMPELFDIESTEYYIPKRTA